MENNAIIKCTNVLDDSFCTVIILKYKVYRDDTGKLFGQLLVLKHKVENFLKEVLDEDLLYQNPLLQRTKDGLLDLFQGLTALCSGISQSREMLIVPELAPERDASESYEMKFVKGNTLSDVWLCYVDKGALLNLLKRLSEKYENDELEPFIFYPRIGEHVYFKQGQNIFRGIVQEYVIPDETENEERVDVKILNIDNSDVVVLPQNCIFRMDKDGIELPMQCVLCSMQEADITTSDSNSRPLTDLSVGTLKKHKLNVTFQGKKVAAKNLPVEAQRVTITLSVDKLKDKKNSSFNVNSKEFVPRNSIPNDTAVSSSGTSEADSKSVETTRSSSPGSSQDDTATKETVASVGDDRVKSQSANAPPTAATPGSGAVAGPASARGSVASSPSPVNHHGKDRTAVDSIKRNVINHTVSAKDTSHVAATANVFRPSAAHPPAAYDKERNAASNAAAAYNRYGSPKAADAVVSKVGGKSVAAVVDKLKNVTAISSPNNETRTKVMGAGGGPPASPHSSQAQSPANMPPNAQMPPYLFLPPGPVPFPGQFMHIPASVAATPGHPPQQLGSSMPLFLPPYPPAYLSPAASAPPPPASAHSQPATYHMPPASSPYQPYMQPMAVAPFFSQPPFSQQFYQASHMQHSWSHLPPSYHVAGAGGGGANANVQHQGGGGGGLNKSDVPAGPLMSSKFK